MTPRWQCPNGHDGEGRPPMPACPACGLPVTWVIMEQPAVAVSTDSTLVHEHAPLAITGASRGSNGVDRSHSRSAAAVSWPAEGQLATNGLVASSTKPQPLPESSPSNTFVQPSAAPSLGPKAAGAPEPAILTGYEILGVLGRGGMGVVYKARQIGLNRLVALKMILAGEYASPEELARFRTEAEAIARLQHPNIVQVFDIGERDGRPFISLEFCEGGSLQQRLDGAPMLPRQAAGMLETIARAVALAHQQGIVHRDLKPANILLTADGTPKITDFGLAKRLEEDEGHTGTEAVLGTPTYMAPEQACGRTRQVGPPADVYALGAVFYDLLTGRPPFRGTTALDTLQLVRSAEPIPPGRLQPSVPRDLQTICLKCLEKEPARRYATAGELASDLRRFLEGRPIHARPSTAPERAWKWACRHPAVALAAGLAILAPLVVTGVSVGFSLALANKNAKLDAANSILATQADELASRKQDLEQSNAALGRTVEQLHDREKALAGANVKLRETNVDLGAALDRMTKAERDAQGSFLTALDAAEDLLGLTRRELRRPGSEKIRQALLKRAIAMCQRFTDRPGEHPVAQLRAARAHRLSGELESAFGNLREAVRQLEASIALFERLTRRGPEARVAGVDYEAELIATYLQLWGVLESVNRPRAEKALSSIEQRLNAAGERRSELEYRRLTGLWLLNRAVHHQVRGRPGAAREDYDRSIAELELVADRPDIAVELARGHINLAALLTAGRDRLVDKVSVATPAASSLAQARKSCDRAVTLLERLVRDDEDSTVAEVLGQAYTNLGLVLALQNEYEQAGRTYQRAVDLFQGLVDRAPLDMEYRHFLAVAQGNLGAHLLRQKKPEAARKQLAAARATLEQLTQSYRTETGPRLDLARLATAEGIALVTADDVPGSERYLREAVRRLEDLVREYPRRADLHDCLLIAIRNLVFCQDWLARTADAKLDRRTSAWHVGELVKLRRKYEELLPPVDGPWPQRLARWWARLAAREELVGTLRAHASVLEAVDDHAVAARGVGELRALLAASWPGWVEYAALLSRCSRLAREDRSLSGPEQTRLAREYGGQAMRLLERLAERPPDELARRLTSRDFDPLRTMFRDDFRRLVERLPN